MVAFSVPTNLAFDNYADLSTAIQDWMDRTDLSGSVQQMIALAESRINRELMPYFSEASTDVTTESTGLGSLPLDYGIIKRVIYSDRALPQLSLVGATDVPTDYSYPYAYTLEQNRIRLWPSKAFTVSVLYQPRLVSLSEANPTNTLLSQHPDLYFFGTMLFAEGYVVNDSRAALFKGLFDETLESVRQYLTHEKMGGPLMPRVGFVP